MFLYIGGRAASIWCVCVWTAVVRFEYYRRHMYCCCSYLRCCVYPAAFVDKHHKGVHKHTQAQAGDQSCWTNTQTSETVRTRLREDAQSFQVNYFAYIVVLDCCSSNGADCLSSNTYMQRVRLRGFFGSKTRAATYINPKKTYVTYSVNVVCVCVYHVTSHGAILGCWCVKQNLQVIRRATSYDLVVVLLKNAQHSSRWANVLVQLHVMLIALDWKWSPHCVCVCVNRDLKQSSVKTSLDYTLGQVCVCVCVLLFHGEFASIDILRPVLAEVDRSIVTER